MKKIGFLFSVMITLSSLAQSEFNEFENGLIYSPEAISKLQEIVGDKNEAFRTCDLSKEFYSFPQTKGFFIEVKSNTKELIEDLQSNIDLDDFLRKYNIGDTPKLRLIVQWRYKNYENKEVVEISEKPEGTSITVAHKNFSNFQNKKWIFKKYNDKRIGIFYLEKPLGSKPIPKPYARMIQYAECMIDSTSQIHFKNARRSTRRSSNKGVIVKKKKFYKYIAKKFGQKEPEFGTNLTGLEMEESFSSDEYIQFVKSHKNWIATRTTFIKEVLSTDKKFMELLNNAYDEAVVEKNSDDEFEEYVIKYLSKEKALGLKRNRIAYGTCSMDQSPRIHAMNIAQLSAETYNWDIFLRAHLNVMNDRFRRMSDGNYAFAQRHTYIKELETLDIDVPELISGISFRVNNPSKNHYYSSIRRVGRALAESNQKDKITSDLVKVIKDPTLDDYNRLIMFYLYRNFRYYQKDSYTKSHIEYIASLLPEYMRPQIKT